MWFLKNSRLQCNWGWPWKAWKAAVYPEIWEVEMLLEGFHTAQSISMTTAQKLNSKCLLWTSYIEKRNITLCDMQKYDLVQCSRIQDFSRETFVLVWFSDICPSNWSILIRAQPEPQKIDLNFPRVQWCSDLAFGLAHHRDKGWFQKVQICKQDSSEHGTVKII